MMEYRSIISAIGKIFWGLLVCVAAGLGCVRSESAQNVGYMCVEQAEAEEDGSTVVADEPLQVEIMVCGSGNWESVDTWCDAEVSGQEIAISSRFDYEYIVGDAYAACVMEVATCELPALSEGTYTVTHGEREKELVVPSEEVLDCTVMEGQSR